MNKLYSDDPNWNVPMTPGIGKNRIKLLKNEFNTSKVVFKNGDGGKLMDCRMDEHAWNESVSQNPKMLDMFRGKLATSEDAVSVDNIIHRTPASPCPCAIRTSSYPGYAKQEGACSSQQKRSLFDPPNMQMLQIKEGRGAITKLVESKASNANTSIVVNAVKILYKMGINDDAYIMTIDFLGEEKAARTFVDMTEDKRKLILGKKFNATFDVVPAENMDADTIVNFNTHDDDKIDLDIDTSSSGLHLTDLVFEMSTPNASNANNKNKKKNKNKENAGETATGSQGKGHGITQQHQLESQWREPRNTPTEAEEDAVMVAGALSSC
eukprot:jgi/Psemu1/10379/gm1.10379_g